MRKTGLSYWTICFLESGDAVLREVRSFSAVLREVTSITAMRMQSPEQAPQHGEDREGGTRCRALTVIF